MPGVTTIKITGVVKWEMIISNIVIWLVSVFDTLTSELAKGEKIQLAGFGTFKVKERSERVGRNPKTRQEIKIPASKAPAFVAGKALKDAVNK